MCEITEAVWRKVGGEPPVYIIGSEVPVPGGAHETLQELAVTTPQAAHATIDAHRRAFARHGVEAAWSRVIGLVVQPGVEFDHHQVIDYIPSKAAALSRSIESVPGMVFEAHSTDYQAPQALQALVRDHFAILKVGPGVTFALREVFWALSDIAAEMGLTPPVSVKETLLGEMRRNPRYWKSYYTSSGERGLRSPIQPERPVALLLEHACRRAGLCPTVGAPGVTRNSADADQSISAGTVRRDPRGPAAK